MAGTEIAAVAMTARGRMRLATNGREDNSGRGSHGSIHLAKRAAVCQPKRGRSRPFLEPWIENSAATKSPAELSFAPSKRRPAPGSGHGAKSHDRDGFVAR